MTTAIETRRPRTSEEGYMLAVLTLMVALLIMSLAVALPRVRDEIRRDQEIEAMHRGQQYIRALQLYYRRFHGYPTNIDALEDSNNIRFLRKKYSDPLTGKDDWKPIFYGQNKAPTAIGFFGMTLGTGITAASGAGIGAVPAASLGGGASASNSGSDGSGDSSASNSGASVIDQAQGGGPIIGFSPISTKQSILVYKTKDHYNQWEFVYDPYADLGMRGTVLAPQEPPQKTGAPGFNPGASLPTPVGGPPPSQETPQ